MEIRELHACPADCVGIAHSTGASVDVVKVKDDEDNIGWFLQSRTFVTEQDVRMGEGDNEGDIITDSLISIAFCPFCGEKLKK